MGSCLGKIWLNIFSPHLCVGFLFLVLYPAAAVFGCHRCPSRNKVDFCQNKAYFGKNRPYFLTGNNGNQKLVGCVLKGQACAFLVAIVARQKIRLIFVKNTAYFGKNGPYFLTGRWAAAWAKFGSTFFPHIFVWGSCFWFCIHPAAAVFGCHRCPSRNKVDFCQK